MIIFTTDYIFSQAGIVKTLERENYDWRLLRQASDAVKNDEIVIVDIDRDSLRKIGPWPWPRKTFSDLNDSLFGKYNVRVVGYALPFQEPNDAVIRLLENLEQRLKEDRQYQISPTESSSSINWEQLRTEFDYDRLFAESLENRSIVLGYLFDESGRIQASLPPSGKFVDASPSEENKQFNISALSRDWLFLRGLNGNLPALLRSSNYSAGHLNFTTDDDGVTRKAPALIKHSAGQYWSLPIAMLRKMLNKSISDPLEAHIQSGSFLSEAWISELMVGHLGVRITPDAHTYLNFLGRGGPNVDFNATRDAVFRYVSFSEVVEGTTPENFLSDKIVLVGSSSDVLRDLYSTPVNPVMPGVELIAVQLANILNDNVLHQTKNASTIELALLLFTAIILSILFVYLGPLLSFFILLAVLGGYLFFVLNQWDNNNQIWAIVPITLVTSGLFMFNAVVGFIAEWNSSRRLKSTFGQYVPKEFAKEIGDSGKGINLEGELRELSILFSDIRGFTTIAEGMAPRDLTLLMNRMLTILSQAIHNNSGTVDKYIGDAVMAMWNAPLSDTKHASHAVAAAFEMQAAIKRLSHESVKNGFPEIKMGVGIATGPANVGNMGSELRMAYTAIGDNVNLASRVEGATKFYQCPILVSETTYEQCKEEYLFRIVDIIRVKGRNKPVTLYEPIGKSELVPPDKRENLKTFEQCRQLYIEGKFSEAIEILRDFVIISPDDGLAQVYLDRCTKNAKNPPTNWDGITSFKIK